MPRYIDAYFAQQIADAELGSSDKGTVQWILAHTPNADVREVRHGRWIRATPCSQDYCNKCGLTPKTIFGKLPPFCPNCGAKMEGVWEDET